MTRRGRSGAHTGCARANRPRHATPRRHAHAGAPGGRERRRRPPPAFVGGEGFTSGGPENRYSAAGRRGRGARYRPAARTDGTWHFAPPPRPPQPPPQRRPPRAGPGGGVPPWKRPAVHPRYTLSPPTNPRAAPPAPSRGSDRPGGGEKGRSTIRALRSRGLGGWERRAEGLPPPRSPPAALSLRRGNGRGCGRSLPRFRWENKHTKGPPRHPLSLRGKSRREGAENTRAGCRSLLSGLSAWPPPAPRLPLGPTGRE